MQAVPEDIQILFEGQSDQATSEGSSTASSEAGNRDYHREQYPSYQPPHRRGHNVQPGDEFVNFKNRDPRKGPDPDKVEGVDNDKYQRLKLAVPFALDRKKLAMLKAEFPGVYFHVKDNGNHDHQFSHVVTMIGTRMLQRRLKPGSRTLDVYGNAIACDRFNRTQVNAANPKHMKALHLRVGPADFIREVNKWGPELDDEGDNRYHMGTLGDMVRSGEIAQYDRLQFIHTLYYQDFKELTTALHSPCTMDGKRVAYALIHRHDHQKGSINDGEQTYIKKVAPNGVPLVKQTNVITKSEYVHKDLTPLLFRADKTWFPDDGTNLGLTWECHMVNAETWIIEIVPYKLTKLRDDVVDYNALWDMDEEDYLSTDLETPDPSASGIELKEQSIIIPTADGQFIDVEIVNRKLFNLLRTACIGKERNRATLDEMVRLAKHHVSPSSMFGDKEGLRCPEDKIYDHVIAAFFADLDHETKVMKAASELRPCLLEHASKLNLGPKFKDYNVRNLLEALKTAISVARHVNTVVKSKDPVDRGLEILGNQFA